MVALGAALAVLVVGAVLVRQYHLTSTSVAEVSARLAPANEAATGLGDDINAMDRRLRIYVTSGDDGYWLLYQASVTSARRNLGKVDSLVGGTPPFEVYVDDVAEELDHWLQTVGAPVEQAMTTKDPVGAQEILDDPPSQSSYTMLVTENARLVALIEAEQDDTLSETEAAAGRLLLAIAMAMALAVLLPAASLVALHRQVLAPIDRLRRQLRATAAPGGHDSVIVPSGPRELVNLGTDAEALRRALVTELDQSNAARSALEQEGPVVDAIRHELAAREEPGGVGVQIEGILRPAEGMLAGDFWDRIALPDGRSAAIVCDVSGHGPRAGIVAMRLKTAITLGLISGQGTPEILHRACDTFVDEPGRFATVAILVADPRSGTLEWVNAGHPAPRVIRPGGRIERLDPTGPMVSWLIGAWTTRATELLPGDVCLAFTDGVLESRDAVGDELGDDALDAMLVSALPESSASTDLPDLTARVMGQIRERAVDIGRDDLTLVGLRIEPVEAVQFPSPRR